MSHWSSQKLKGESQVIPRVCPNCLEEADIEMRYGYKGLKGWLTNTTYYQSFHYCEPCASQVGAQGSVRAYAFWFCVLGFFGGLIAWAFAMDAAPKSSPLPLLAPLAVVLILSGLFWWIRASRRKKFPKTGEQAVWGIAAVYCGSGIDMNSSIFRAARQEWLAALVAANPDKVDDATYESVVGRPKPETSTAAPFGQDLAAPSEETRQPQGASGPFG